MYLDDIDDGDVSDNGVVEVEVVPASCVKNEIV